MFVYSPYSKRYSTTYRINKNKTNLNSYYMCDPICVYIQT